MARGVLGSLLLLAGGLLTQVLPPLDPVAGAAPLVALRGSGGGRAIGYVLVWVGVGLLAWAWVGLLRAAPGLLAVRQAVTAWTVPLVVAPPLFSRDGWSYAAQGALTHLGLSPYVWTPSIFDGPLREGVDPLWWNTAAPYGPLPLGWGAAVAAVTHDPWLMVVGHRLLALAGLALLAWAVPRLAARTGVDPARASAVALASPLTLAHGVGGLHNDLAMSGLMAAALAVVSTDHTRAWLLGAVLAGAAAAVKVPGGLVAISVALASLPAAAPFVPRARRLVQVALVAVGVVVLLGLAVGVGVGWVRALGVPATVATRLSLTTQVGGLVGHLDLVRAAGLVVVAAATVGYAARGRTGAADGAVRSTALLVTALVVLSPVVWVWYLLWALPFAAVVPWRRTAGAWTQAARELRSSTAR